MSTSGCAVSATRDASSRDSKAGRKHPSHVNVAKTGHILLVEDEEGVRDVLHEMLASAGYDVQDAGYDVQDAASGAAVLEAYRRQSADLIITDILMGEGLGLIMDVRRDHAGAKILAISRAAQRYLNLARQFGADRTLPKPFSKKALLTAVAELLGTLPLTSSPRTRPSA